MPILEIPSPDAPLGQGDFLKGVNLHATMVSGEADVEPDQMANPNLTWQPAIRPGN